MTINELLKNYDPVKNFKSIAEIIIDYNELGMKGNRIISHIKQFYIRKIKYPITRYKIEKMEKVLADFILENPDQSLDIINRYLISYILYCHLFKLNFNEVVKKIIPNENELSLELFTRELSNGAFELNKYNIITRYNTLCSKESRGKYTITNLSIDVDNHEFHISQTVYDTDDYRNSSLAEVIFEKSFELDRHGRLINPNYAFSKELLEDDLKILWYMMSHVLGVMSGIYNAFTTLYFVKKEL